MVNLIVAISALLLVVISLIFLPIKIFRKDLESSRYTILYQVHANAPKLGTILAFVHGLTVALVDPTRLLTGWGLGISLILLLVLGAFVSIKTKAQPLDDQGDTEWKTVRVVKWVLTVAALVLLVLHIMFYA